uniref:Transcription initiation factor TFIID subunit 4-like n=1 Tax=Saccoglossus kowalevskii TaxID=10224 RepID=A0ABM0GXS9_SACKO|nr:PREDICTED: transcription initiation factor TFIID subunit 4-like [Saccoglossus kowalevskii]
MASADSSLEDILTSEVDESAVSALVGSLESQLAAQIAGVPQGQVSANSVTNNHVGDVPITSTNIVQSAQSALQKAVVLGNTRNSNSNSLSNSPVTIVDQTKNGSNNQSVTINSVVSSGVTTPTAVVAPTTMPQQNATSTATTCVRIITLPSTNVTGRHVLTTQHLANSTKATTVTSSSPLNVGARTSVSGSSANTTTPTVVRIVTTQGIQTNVPSSTTPVVSSVQNLNTKVLTTQGITPPVKLTVREQLAHHQINKQTNVPQVILKRESNTPPQQTMSIAQSTGTVVKSTVSNTPQYVTVNVPGQGAITIPTSSLSGNTRVISTSQPQLQHKVLTPPRFVSAPIRIAAAPQAIAPRPTGIPLSQGLTLPPGMMLVKQEGGNYLIQNTAVAGTLQAKPNACSVPGTATYRFTTVQPGTQVVTGPPQVSMHQQPSVHQQQVVTMQQQHHQQQQQPAGSVQKSGSNIAASSHLQTQSPIVIQHMQKGISNNPPNATTSTQSVPMTTITSVPLSSGVAMPTTSIPSISTASQVVSSTAPGTIIPTPTTTTTTLGAQTIIPVPQSAMENVKKCRNFLTTLIKLASNQPAETIRNVKDLVQSLIRSLPLLRQTLHKSPIQGLTAPMLTSTGLNAATITVTSTTAGTSTAMPVTNTITLTQQQLQQLQQQQKLQQMQKLQQDQLGKLQHSKHVGARHIVVTQHGTSVDGVTTASNFTAATAKSFKGHHPVTFTSPSHKDRAKYSSTFKDDDDINDVASMAGVNLSEESARILATNAEFIGTQLRSCKDEHFLHSGPLQKRISDICKKFGLDEPSSEMSNIISHATQERLKTLVEKLALIAQHRMEVYKNDSRYEMTDDIKSKLRFFEQLDALERKRHDEQEREMLLRAAKSRSRQEDPEQLRLKQKAKEMQQMEMEQMRKRDANMTALLAIGPRKKRKIDSPIPGSSSSFSQGGGNNSTVNSSSSSSLGNRPQIKRVKRVNLRDLVFLLEQEKETKKSTLLYKAFLK